MQTADRIKGLKQLISDLLPVGQHYHLLQGSSGGL